MPDPITDAELDRLISALDLAAKLRLITGKGMWKTVPLPEIGLRSLTMSDGPIGVRGTRFAENDVSAAFPSSSALAATWDDDLLYRIGSALAAEAVRKSVDVVLGPTINLHRSPLGGRHFECYSEDPYLSGRLATSYVNGVQDHGVGACPKHYVANDAETDRHTVDNVVDERTLRELYLAPFEAVVADARPWMVMAAYNGVNGAPMSENELLADPLKQEWQWDGVVVSDWGGVYSTVASACAQIDLAMPGPEPRWCDPLAAAVRSGEVAESAIDEKVRRLLRLAARSGVLEGSVPAGAKQAAVDVTAASALAREAAAASMVLLRNDGVLPLDKNTIRRLALLGPNAVEPRALGGGSATVFPPYVAAPRQALQDLLGNQAEVTIAVGAALNDAPRAAYPEEIANTSVRWLDENGAVLSEEPSSTARLHRARGAFPRGAVSLELTTQFTPSVDGEWRLGASGHGHVEVAIGDAVVLADELGHETSVLEAMADPPTATVRCHLESGQTVDVVVRYRWRDDFFIFVAGLVVQEPRGTDDEEITRAVDLARSAEVAVVIVGTSETVESEGRDRADIRLPGRQDELVSAVAAANPRTIVVVNAGSPVEMPWRDDVAAVLVCWFPGMEFGTALAEVLLGEVEPGGRLPTSWPASLDDAPVTTTTPTDGRLHYDEGVHIGYRGYLRAGVDPAYWFGHGLGYTTWAYEHLAATSSSARVRIRNTGSRRGKEVVQIYTSWPDTTIDRPARVLSGYAVVVADPGETVEVDVAIEPRTLRYWDATTHSWQSESGSLVVQAGPSAGELPLAQPVRNREAG